MEKHPEFLDPEMVTEISDDQKQFYLKQGYRPYRNEQGVVKWAIPNSHVFRKLKSYRSNSYTSTEPKAPPFYKRMSWIIWMTGLVSGLTGLWFIYRWL